MLCCGWMEKVVLLRKTQVGNRLGEMECCGSAASLLWKHGDWMRGRLESLHLDWKELKLKLTVKAVIGLSKPKLIFRHLLLSINLAGTQSVSFVWMSVPVLFRSNRQWQSWVRSSLAHYQPLSTHMTPCKLPNFTGFTMTKVEPPI